MTLAFGILLLWIGAACLWWAMHSAGRQGDSPLWTAYKDVLGTSFGS